MPARVRGACCVTMYVHALCLCIVRVMYQTIACYMCVCARMRAVDAMRAADAVRRVVISYCKGHTSQGPQILRQSNVSTLS
eukprot:3657859-Lingulodinium_polyedra.AAC.1